MNKTTWCQCSQGLKQHGAGVVKTTKQHHASIVNVYNNIVLVSTTTTTLCQWSQRL